MKILAKNESNIRSYLERLQFLEERIQKGFDTTAENSIILSTIHSSKGLEYDTVYMVDVYDGKFPSSNPNIFSKSKDSSDGEQEERRLFYVGITRAKNSLNLFSITHKNSSYIEELFPAIKAEREEKKRRKQEALQKKNAEQARLKEIRLKSIYRQEIEERAARYRKFEEQRKKEAAELEKKKAAEDQRCLESVLKIIDQQYYPARDQKDRRWVRCEICGAVKQDKDFSSYGGFNHVNLGICSACAKKSRK
ncbi:MAG: ATP-binding domain-containing protein [Clostridia bacterium]|nr:ATP-binding domain-containing protein [Clostridia bacterium]